MPFWGDYCTGDGGGSEGVEEIAHAQLAANETRAFLKEFGSGGRPAAVSVSSVASTLNHTEPEGIGATGMSIHQAARRRAGGTIIFYYHGTTST